MRCPVQLVEEVRTSLPAGPGQPARYDYEYRQCGTANLFITFGPLLGWLAVRVTADGGRLPACRLRINVALLPLFRPGCSSRKAA
jgi:hypothetical protein